MSTVGELALQRLLERAESAASNEHSARKVRLPFTLGTFKQYLNIPTRAEMDTCHGVLQLAEHVGAICIAWNAKAGPRNQIDAIELLDGEILAQHIGVKPRWQSVSEAKSALMEHLEEFPVLSEVIAGWHAGRRPKGTGPDQVGEWIMAMKVINHCRAAGVVDLPIRRLSTALLFNSKKLEELLSLVDALLVGDLQLGTREEEDVLNEIGLVKYPPTLLVAGTASLFLEDEQEPLMIRRPYIGVAPEALKSVQYSSDKVPLLLTVENLTTFHELARLQTARTDVVVLYTGGMPSPSFKRAYMRFLDGMPEESAIFHWGDVDAGGFRIADHLARCCAQQGRKLRLHAMVPTMATEPTLGRRLLSDIEVMTITRICQEHQWNAELQAIELSRTAMEQEGLPISWPEHHGTITGLY